MKYLSILVLLAGLCSFTYMSNTSDFDNPKAKAAKAFDYVAKFNANPIQPEQIQRLGSQGFQAWFKASKNINEATKKDFYRSNRSLLTHAQFDATLVRNVRIKNKPGKWNVVVTKVPKVYAEKFGGYIFLLFEPLNNEDDSDSPEIKSCKVANCNGSKPMCCLQGVTCGENCQDEINCSSDKDCGEGCGKQEGDIPGYDEILSTLFY